MGKTILLLASMALALVLACMAAVLTTVPGVAQTTVTLVGAGDIASCFQNNDSATARLLGGIPGTVYTLGDNAYPDGTAAQFRDCYDPTWGKYKRRTRPTAGNHEYNTPGARPYFEYFGSAAGPSGKGYYSYDKGAWPMVVLNSNCSEVAGGCAAGSAQHRWLRRDLAAHRSRCALAYWHHPRFSSSFVDNASVTPFWKALYRAGAEVVLNGHAHNYERFAPQRPDGTIARKRGIREFVVGTGGTDLRAFRSVKPNSRVRNANTFGVLRLILHPGSYQTDSRSLRHIAGTKLTES